MQRNQRTGKQFTGSVWHKHIENATVIPSESVLVLSVVELSRLNKPFHYYYFLLEPRRVLLQAVEFKVGLLEGKNYVANY